MAADQRSAPAPEPADQKPELNEDPADPADPEPAIVAVPLVCPAAAAIVNARRALFGLPPLEIDLGMTQECENHSNWMNSGGGFQHGYYLGGARECIARGIGTAEAAIDLWMNSASHRAIILGRGKKIGIGRAGTYWTLRIR